MATTKNDPQAAAETRNADLDKQRVAEKSGDAPKNKALEERRKADTPKVSHVPEQDVTGTGLEAVTESPVSALESENVIEAQKHGVEATEKAVARAKKEGRLEDVDASPPVDVTPRPDLGEFQSGVNGCLQAIYVYLTANDIFSRQQALNELHQAMKKKGIKIPVPADPTKEDKADA